MQNLILSMVRFSAAVTLYSLEQVQVALKVGPGGLEISKAVENIGAALDSVTDTLIDKIGSGKKEALRSVIDVTGDLFKKTADGMSIIDPKGLLLNTGEFVKKSSDALGDWMGQSSAPESDSEPKPAAEVLQ